jgi:hypothetical protein
MDSRSSIQQQSFNSHQQRNSINHHPLLDFQKRERKLTIYKMPNKNQNVTGGSDSIKEKLSHAAKNLRRNTERVRRHSTSLSQRDQAIIINFTNPISGDHHFREISSHLEGSLRLAQAASKFLK